MNARRQTVDIVVPVHNEEATLAANIEALLDYLHAEYPFRFRIVIADNASADRTPSIAAELAQAHHEVGVLRLERKGRGLALREAWSCSDADVVAYMDVDLSTNLESLLPLVAPILSGHSEVAIGTRLAHHAHVRRRLKRELLSRGYNALIHLLFRAQFSDAQCGFKAIRTDVARRLLPAVEDDGWFFDTELLLHAERAGLRIHEVPVDWIEDLDSRVDLVPTIAGDLRGLVRVRAQLWRSRARDLGAYAVVGVANTLVSAAVYAALTGLVPHALAAGLAFAAGAANGFVWNRRWTFRTPGRASRYALVALAGTAATAELTPAAGFGAALVVVTVATFTANRRWTFSIPKEHAPPHDEAHA